MILTDTSFLTHALLDTQLTGAAVEALASVRRGSDRIALPTVFVVEFLSALRKAVTTRQYPLQQAEAAAAAFIKMDFVLVEPSMGTIARAWQLSVQLGQSDVFDSLGYALAEEIGAEFWTSDQRFFNAATAAGLPEIRYIP